MSRMRDRIRKTRRALRYCTRFLTTPYSDRVERRRWNTGSSPFLALRHPAHLTRYYDSFVAWLAEEMPEVRSQLELHTLPCRIRQWSQFKLLVPWLPDPMLHESRRIYRRVKQIETLCAQHDIAVINPVDHVLRTAKSTGADIVRSVGIRSPRAVPIRDRARFRRDLGGLGFPLLIREDRAHAGRLPIHYVDSMQALDRVPVHEYDHPIAVEFIDVRDPRTGLSRRYRYFAAGELGMAMNVHTSEHWEVRGRNAVRNAQMEADELAFISQPDPNHEPLQAARRALGLDFVAFDYSYGQDGELVVWEANVMPGLGFSAATDRRPYLQAIVDRAFAMVLHLYFRRAGMQVPDRVMQTLEVPVNRWFTDIETRAA